MNKKKILILALTLALCGTMLTSCGGNGNDENSGSETSTRAEEKETNADGGASKGLRRGMNDIANGIMDGANNVKNDVIRGADNVKNGIMDGSINKEDATHGTEATEKQDDSASETEGERPMPPMHRRAVPNGK